MQISNSWAVKNIFDQFANLTILGYYKFKMECRTVGRPDTWSTGHLADRTLGRPDTWPTGHLADRSTQAKA